MTGREPWCWSARRESTDARIIARAGQLTGRYRALRALGIEGHRGKALYRGIYLVDAAVAGYEED